MDKSQNDNRIIEEQFADFTDQILEKTTAEYDPKFAQEPELRDLEQAAQRLKRAFHDNGPSEAAIQKMRQNILLEWKQQENRTSMPFWKKFSWRSKLREEKWQSQRNRQRLSTVTSLVLVAGAMLVSIFLLNKGDFEQPAASGQNLDFGALALTSGLLLLALWIFRRKL